MPFFALRDRRYARNTSHATVLMIPSETSNAARTPAQNGTILSSGSMIMLPIS